MTMKRTVSNAALRWNIGERSGLIRVVISSGETVILPALNGADFHAVCSILEHPGAVWDGKSVQATLEYGFQDAVPPTNTVQFSTTLPFAESSQAVIDACEDEWPSNKSDCSGFVIDVARSLSISISGSANSIVDAIHGAEWTALAGGVEAKEAADQGKFVIAGLRGDHQDQPSDHGHVAVIVSGPIAKQLYPTAYWGSLGGIGERRKTINWAWKARDRDRVFYASHGIN